MNASTSKVPPQARVIVLAARASAVILVIALFASYRSGNVDVGSLVWVKRQFFPTGVVVGYLLALLWPRLGGLVAPASLAVILGWLAVAGNVNGALLLLPYAIPPALFVAAAAVSQGAGARPGA